MRFLGIGDSNELGDMYLRLKDAGHDVRVFIADENSRDIMQGMLDFTEDWKRELAWIREAGSDGIIVFETASMGETQDFLRREGYNVVGGSAFGDRLEGERELCQSILKELGLNTVATHTFERFDDAISFLRRHPEGLEETLTLHRLGVFPEFGAGFKTTNLIESVMARVEARTRRVNHWKSDQKLRWCASALIALEKQFRSVKGYVHLPLLERALEAKITPSASAAA